MLFCLEAYEGAVNTKSTQTRGKKQVLPESRPDINGHRFGLIARFCRDDGAAGFKEKSPV